MLIRVLRAVYGLKKGDTWPFSRDTKWKKVGALYALLERDDQDISPELRALIDAQWLGERTEESLRASSFAPDVFQQPLALLEELALVPGFSSVPFVNPSAQSNSRDVERFDRDGDGDDDYSPYATLSSSRRRRAHLPHAVLRQPTTSGSSAATSSSTPASTSNASTSSVPSSTIPVVTSAVAAQAPASVPVAAQAPPVAAQLAAPATNIDWGKLPGTFWAHRDFNYEPVPRNWDAHRPLDGTDVLVDKIPGQKPHEPIWTLCRHVINSKGSDGASSREIQEYLETTFSVFANYDQWKVCLWSR